MKNLSQFINNLLNENKLDELEKKADDAADKADDAEKEANKTEESIKDEVSFREAARAKFEAVYGDDLDEDEMNEIIDGLLNDNKDLVEKGEWGELIGMLNKSFGK